MIKIKSNYISSILSGLVMLVVVVTSFGEEKPWKCTVEPLEDIYIMTAPIPVRVALQNTTEEPQNIGTDAWGAPFDLFLSLTLDGKLVDFKRAPQNMIRELNFPRLTVGETLKMVFNLNEIYKLNRNGIYKLSVLIEGKSVAESEFQLCNFKTVQEVAVTGNCALPWQSPIINNAFGELSCETMLVQLDQEKDKKWFLTTQNILIKNMGQPWPWDVPSVFFPIPPESEVKMSEIDYLGQVWILLKSGSKQCLVVWDVRDGQYVVAIPWAEQKIEIQTTAVASGRGARLVIAGIPGGTKISSSSFKDGKK